MKNLPTNKISEHFAVTVNFFFFFTYQKTKQKQRTAAKIQPSNWPRICGLPLIPHGHQ